MLPRRKSQVLGIVNTNKNSRIEHIYVINLNRQQDRWIKIKKELKSMLDWSGADLLNISERFTAVDANNLPREYIKDDEVDPIYTLGDQLFVEPQPLALPTKLELNTPIRMSRAEIAVALSHINLWRQIATQKHEYVLILEDDVWFQFGFAKYLDQAWNEIMSEGEKKNKFDILYLSYEEVKNGTPKVFLTKNVFRPLRGLWNMSGYVITRKGAEKLLKLLPCRGPVDLWVNHQFTSLDVRATRKSIINQRRDIKSSNSYSILPSLTKIGVITSESASLFQTRPGCGPVFVFGSEGSGLTSLAMALSMLGYRCCNDLKNLPDDEFRMLITGSKERIFDAYVNIGTLINEVGILKKRYPQAKFIITISGNTILDYNISKILELIKGVNYIILPLEKQNKWQIVCEHLRCVPPPFSFPGLDDLGQRQIINRIINKDVNFVCKIPERDKSPWIIETRQWWQGIHYASTKEEKSYSSTRVSISDCLTNLDLGNWILREDTFTDNLALFRPSNIGFSSKHGVALSIKEEPLGVREYSAGSLTSHGRYLYGKFEAIIKASNTNGVVTGFFLHRNSPRQEIDIEITGNHPDRLLVNVFYNPGGEGALFDYGYRGAASYINLGFDASESEHKYSIEWSPCEIRWSVDNILVHRRTEWEPTPIPKLPMSLHVNVWPTRSKELAGRLTKKQLPSTTYVKLIEVEANLIDDNNSIH